MMLLDHEGPVLNEMDWRQTRFHALEMCDQLSTLAAMLRSLSPTQPDGAELFERIVGEMRREVEFVFDEKRKTDRADRWSAWSESELAM